MRHGQRGNFNPHSPCGERPGLFNNILGTVLFQSTLPMRGATFVFAALPRPDFDFNPHSPCGERLRERFRPVKAQKDFNPHSPCGERRKIETVAAKHIIFQSTLPMRGATGRSVCENGKHHDFNPHSPCGERLLFLLSLSCGNNFNPHSPCGERPPRSPCRPSRSDFNPHSPCGERPRLHSCFSQSCRFQSTLPMRGATRYDRPLPAYTHKFQSTLPMRGATNA